MSVLVSAEVAAVIAMAREYAEEAVKRGDVYAPARMSEMGLCAQELCDCKGRACGGCGASLKLAGEMDDLVPMQLKSELVDEARAGARERFTRQRELIAAFNRSVGRKTEDLAREAKSPRTEKA